MVAYTIIEQEKNKWWWARVWHAGRWYSTGLWSSVRATENAMTRLIKKLGV